MGSLFRDDFSGGWRPSDIALSEPKNGLLRMKNLKLDEQGALTLIPGTAKVSNSSQTHAAVGLFSRFMKYSGGSRIYRFISTDDGATSYDAGGAGTFAGTVCGAGTGSLNKVGYCAAYGQVLICSGPQKLKFNPRSGYITPPLGPGSPATAPTISLRNPFTVNLTETLASYTAIVGTYATAGGYGKITGDATTFEASVIRTYASPINTISLSDGSTTTAGSDNDRFHMTVQSTDITKLLAVVVQFGNASDPANYFVFQWNIGEGAVNGPSASDLSLECNRADFEWVGLSNTATRDWSNIGFVRIYFIANGPQTGWFKDLYFTGGVAGPLAGTLEYIQVNVLDNTDYIARGAASPIKVVYANNTSTSITVVNHTSGTNNFPNTGWEIYRRGGNLERFYLVASGVGIGATITDSMDDDAALLQGITFDENLRPISSITDDILGIEGPLFSRIFYFTLSDIYISEQENPDSYNLGYGVITGYGSSGEFFLWAKKYGNSVILVGTTNDIYEISGTLASLPDGTLDVSIRPLGIKNPPVADCVAADGSNLFYLASDGIRKISPTGNEVITGPLDLLFKKQTRYGISYVLIGPDNNQSSKLAVSKNELYFSFSSASQGRLMFACDMLRGYYWRQIETHNDGKQEPAEIFTEEDGTLLAAGIDTSDVFVRTLNTGTLLDGSGKPNVYFRSKSFHAEMPYNRKDSFVLKLLIDTGGDNLTIGIYKDNATSVTSLGSVTSSGLSEVFFDISATVGICKAYSLEIYGQASAFKLVHFGIEFQEKPTQLAFYRSIPTNYGVQGRKRIYELPIAIDTQGSEVTWKVYADGTVVDAAGIKINTGTNGKQVKTYQFSAAVICRDVYYTLQLTSGTAMFEFYNDIQPRVIEPFPDSVKYFVIPNTNLGTYARKRIIAFALSIDTSGHDVTFTPSVDGSLFPSATINCNGKFTYIYYFVANTIGTDIGGILSGSYEFEFYEVAISECIFEKLPPRAKQITLAATNLNTYSRKRITAFAFVIDTGGHPVTFIPSIDGVAKTAQNFNTNFKQTVVYYFTTDTIGVDIGGQLSGNYPFEYYGPDLDECISEKLPTPTEFLAIPSTNFGTASKKRIRTVPIVIDTKGSYVVYTPFVDGVQYPSSNLVSTEKRTLFHYFTDDVFGVDLRGTLSGTVPFEFYQIITPELVEVLPVGKLFDQLGPVDFNKIATLRAFRYRCLATGTSLVFKIYIDDILKQQLNVTTFPNIDKTYDIPWTNKFLNGTTCRIEVVGNAVFHRWSGDLKVTYAGAQTQNRWLKLGGSPASVGAPNAAG